MFLVSVRILNFPLSVVLLSPLVLLLFMKFSSQNLQDTTPPIAVLNLNYLEIINLGIFSIIRQQYFIVDSRTVTTIP